MSTYSESQRRACKKYYDLHRESRLEKAKEYAKERYVPVIKTPKVHIKKKTKKEYKMEFINEHIPMIKEKLNMDKDEDLRLESFEKDGWTYYNFRKLIFEHINEPPMIEIYIARYNNDRIHERAFFYYEHNDWNIQNYIRAKK
jgi:hypothetical protein